MLREQPQRVPYSYELREALQNSTSNLGLIFCFSKLLNNIGLTSMEKMELEPIQIIKKGEIQQVMIVNIKLW